MQVEPKPEEVEQLFYELSLIFLNHEPLPQQKADQLPESVPQIVNRRAEQAAPQYIKSKVAV